MPSPNCAGLPSMLMTAPARLAHTLSDAATSLASIISCH